MKTLIAVALVVFPLAAAAEPMLSSITPASGSVAGGDYVHIHGTDLQLVPVPCPTPCALKVTFGGVEAQVVIDTDEEIIAIAPPHAAGAVDVQVALAVKGTVTIANGYRYEDPLPSDAVRFVVPIVVNAPGALGSNWVSELRITNASVETLATGGTTIAPQSSARITLNPSIGPGAFFFVPKRIANRITATLRVHDTSRDAESFGTDIPVISETQFRAAVLIPNVPTDPRFRSLLRIYAPISGSTTVAIAIRDDDNGTLLTTQKLGMESYAQVAIDPIPGRSRLRLEITSTGQPPIPIWAFVAVTNNATQQVTPILPSEIAAPAPVSALATGHWGGGGICMQVTETSVSLSNGCGTYIFFRPLSIANGHFEADGTLTPGFGAPPIEPIQSLPVHVSGTLQGNDLTLVITGSSTPQITYHVTLGSTAQCNPPCP
jgi:hypothetical protein